MNITNLARVDVLNALEQKPVAMILLGIAIVSVLAALSALDRFGRRR